MNGLRVSERDIVTYGTLRRRKRWEVLRRKRNRVLIFAFALPSRALARPRSAVS